MTRVLVCGGRDLADFAMLSHHLDALHTQYNFHFLIHGGARGADSLAMEWAVKNKINFRAYPANWGKYGKNAGHIRNKQMLDEGKPDLVVAFPGGTGTANMIAQAKLLPIPIVIIHD